VIKRSLESVGLLAGVVLASFLLFRVVPGDPARTVLGPNASQEAVDRLRADMGVDRPLLAQFGDHVGQLCRLDLGRSLIDGRRVAPEVVGKFAISARLALVASLVSLILSYAIACLAYVRRVPWVVGLTRWGAVAPTYCTGVLAALFFGVLLPVVPLTGSSSGAAGWAVLLLPGLVAAAYPTAVMTRILHEQVQAAAVGGYARTAEAYGFARGRVFHGTILPAVAVPWLGAWVNQLSIVFVAAFVLEVIFTIPGTGVLLVQAIQRKDYPILQGILLANAAFFIVLSWLSEMAFARLDPRYRTHA
jgi:peptide/nickel transport system permease protein